MQMQALPARKRAYAKNRAKGMNMTQAALAAGYAHSTAKTASTHIETPDVKAVFRSLMQAALPPKSLVAVVQEGLMAVDTRLASVDGKFTDERKVPDYATRLKYLQAAAEYAGYVSTEEKQQSSVHVLAMLQSQPVLDQPSSQPAIDVPSEQS
jgi:hypothetical protein